MTQTVLGIAGWKNSGKTTLTTRLVAALVARGYSVSTVKHAHHEADVDREGTDSHRHRQAGAREVALVTARRWALMHELGDEPEPTLDAILARISPVDLVIVEGFKHAPIPKLEVRRLEAQDDTPLSDDPHVIAVAGDLPSQAGGRPFFALDDVAAIADFIADRLKLVLKK
jgi:molybdopterin-guanine dinucleotide biosynthesis adapter protein